MEDFWTGAFVRSRVLWVTLLAWITSQSIKIILGVISKRKFNFYWILSTGGMPSSHSAGVVALAVSIGKREGFSSSLFALACIFALVTMFDAQTWRRSVGVQARILNKIMADVHSHKKISDNRLKELVGHTPTEVFVGALIGIIISLLFYH
jgi:hypothetical protein